MSVKTNRSDNDLLAEIEADNDQPGTPIDGIYVREIANARDARDNASADLAAAVRKAREAGVTWRTIGAVLGVTRQGAMKAYRD